MDTEIYTAMRQFADSWGLVYMFAIFVAVALFIFRPGARKAAENAATIVLRDDYPADYPANGETKK